MPVKKLIDAVVFGLGATAGKRMFEELEEKVEKALLGDEHAKPETPEKPEETPKQRAKREKEARKARVREDAEVDKELAALKKRIQK
jgi:hypothetical protein